jgi:pimeloyl-ACP methyl ester carboxylesterase
MELVVDRKTVRIATGGRPLDPGRPLLVLLHGAGMDHTVWSLTMRALAHGGYSVCAPDLPGHGRSEGPAPLSVEEYAVWAYRLIGAAGGGPAHVAGHSMGSLIALELAAKRPELVASLTLMGTAATMPVHPEMQAAADAGDHAAIDLMVSWGLAPSAHLGRHPTPGLTLRESGMRLMERTDPAVIASDLRASSGYVNAAEAAAAVTCPTLILLAERDMMTPVRNAAPLREAMLHARVETIHASGHTMMTENPNAVLNAMLDFLAHL